MPPLIRKEYKSILFLQNRLLIEKVIEDITYENFKNKTKLYFERLWFKFFLKNVDEIIVQSRTMDNILNQNFNPQSKITIFPFCIYISFDCIVNFEFVKNIIYCFT